VSRVARREVVVAFGCGLLFSAGLALSGMTLPTKVVGFFDFSAGLASWDPSLGLVMGGGLLVFAPAWQLAKRRGKPLFGASLLPRASARIDAKLVGGAALFGVGWGLVGYCPGPAVASLGAASTTALLTVLGMLAGMGLVRAARSLAGLAQRGEEVDSGAGGT
jgi:uncharacterized membrane protein YedE/YeeE